MKQYYFTISGLFIDEKNVVIPQIEGNTLYEEQVLWQINGGTFLLSDYQTPEEIEEYNKSLIPQYNTPRQFKLALLYYDTTPEMVADFINNLPEPNRTNAGISYNSASIFDRWNEDLNAFATAMGISQETLDNVFILGATIQ